MIKEPDIEEIIKNINRDLIHMSEIDLIEVNLLVRGMARDNLTKNMHVDSYFKHKVKPFNFIVTKIMLSTDPPTFNPKDPPTLDSNIVINGGFDGNVRVDGPSGRWQVKNKETHCPTCDIIWKTSESPISGDLWRDCNKCNKRYEDF